MSTFAVSGLIEKYEGYPLAINSVKKFQIPSTKLQINLKFQYSMIKTSSLRQAQLIRIWNFGHWNLFVI